MGNAMTKGEYFNPFLVAIGADMAIEPTTPLISQAIPTQCKICGMNSINNME